MANHDMHDRTDRVVGKPLAAHANGGRRDHPHQHQAEAPCPSGGAADSVLAALLGFFNSFRIMRLPDPRPSSATEGMGLG
jgi:hypothetical protein